MCFQMVFALFFSFLPVSINLRDPEDGSARSSTCWGHAQSLAFRSVQNKPQFQALTQVRRARSSREACVLRSCGSPSFLPDLFLSRYSASSCGGGKEKDEIKLRGKIV